MFDQLNKKYMYAVSCCARVFKLPQPNCYSAPHRQNVLKHIFRMAQDTVSVHPHPDRLVGCLNSWKSEWTVLHVYESVPWDNTTERLRTSTLKSTPWFKIAPPLSLSTYERLSTFYVPKWIKLQKHLILQFPLMQRDQCLFLWLSFNSKSMFCTRFLWLLLLGSSELFTQTWQSSSEATGDIVQLFSQAE